jgi:hypothetical protein
VLVAVVFLFAQVTGVLSAANTTISTSSVYNDPNNAAAAVSSGTTGNTGSMTSINAANSLANYYVNYWKENSWDWLRRTQFSGEFGYGSPQWTISTLQPFNNIDASLEKVWYGSGNYATNTSTMNLGVGYRQMNTKHSSVYGANLFYDNQFKVSDLGGGDTGNAMFQRVGLGLEYFTGSLEATVNGYLGISAPVKVGSNNTNTLETWQNVANGIDLSLKSNLDYFNAPWLSLMVTGYQYFGSMTNSVMANGGSFGGIIAQAGWQVTPQLSLNLGRDFGYQSTTVGFSLNMLAAPQPAMLWGDETINTNATKDLSYKVMQQPQRNNTITVEQYTKSQPSYTYVLAVVDNSGQPLVNTPVTVTFPAATAAAATAAATNLISFTATTDANGIARFQYSEKHTGYIGVTVPYGYTCISGSAADHTTYVSYDITCTPINPVSVCYIAVSDADTTNPLPGATIAIPGVYVPIVATATTGTYRMNNVPANAAGYTGGTVAKSGYTTGSMAPFIPVASATTFVTLQSAILSIAVTPANSTAAIHGTVLYTATATLGNGNTRDVTSSATWSNSDPAHTSWIGTSQLYLGIGCSSLITVTATYNGVSGQTNLTVTPSP